MGGTVVLRQYLHSVDGNVCFILVLALLKRISEDWGKQTRRERKREEKRKLGTNVEGGGGVDLKYNRIKGIITQKLGVLWLSRQDKAGAVVGGGGGGGDRRAGQTSYNGQSPT